MIYVHSESGTLWNKKCGAVAVLNLKHSNHERERQWDCEECTLTARKEHTKTLVFKCFFELWLASEAHAGWKCRHEGNRKANSVW